MKCSIMFLIQVAERCCTQPGHTGIFLLVFPAKDAEHITSYYMCYCLGSNSVLSFPSAKLFLHRIYLPLFRKCLLIFHYQEVSLAYFTVLCQDNKMKRYFSSSQKSSPCGTLLVVPFLSITSVFKMTNWQCSFTQVPAQVHSCRNIHLL